MATMGPLSGTVSVRVPNDINYLPSILAFARSIASAIGFNDVDKSNIELALEEAITNVIRHSLPKNEEAFLDLYIQPLPAGLELRIQDMGRPFDSRETEQYDPDRLLRDQDPKGLGSFLIRNVMDQVEYQSLGNKGKVLRMVKYFKNPPVVYDEFKSIPYLIPTESSPDVSNLSFTVRRLIPGDALALAELAYDTYGYSYIYEDIYYPDRFVALNDTSEVISVVAVSGEGKLVGHTSLYCNPALPGIAEVAMVMVHPDYRAHHLVGKIMVKCFEIAMEMDITALFAQAVTSHPWSQRAIINFGLLPVGLLTGYFPVLEAKGINFSSKERISGLILFKLLREYHAGPVFIPKKHQAMVENLLSRVSVTWESAQANTAEKEHSVYSIQVNNPAKQARMFVYETGKDIIANLKHYLHKLRDEGLVVGELMINLCDPHTETYYEEVEALGFIFTGILPATTRGTFITLIYLNGINACIDNIILNENDGRDLLDYIRSDYESRFL